MSQFVVIFLTKLIGYVMYF